jgi:hypothetical protein
LSHRPLIIQHNDGTTSRNITTASIHKQNSKMEFGMEWDTILERQFKAFRSSVLSRPASSLQTPSATKAGGGRSSAATISTALLPPLAAAASLPLGLYCLYALRRNEDDSAISYEGSCHCQSVRFEMVAPKQLVVETYTETNPYNDVMHRYTKVRTSNFEITLGKDEVTTYYVETNPTKKRSYYRKQPNMGARSFCKRCGVHILYAPSKKSPVMHINITCVSISSVEVQSPETTTAIDKTLSKSDDDGRMIVWTGLLLARLSQDIVKMGSSNKLANLLLEAARKLLLFLKPLSGNEQTADNAVEMGASSDDLSSAVSSSLSIQESPSIQEKRKKKRELEARRKNESPTSTTSQEQHTYHVRQQ